MLSFIHIQSLSCLQAKQQTQHCGQVLLATAQQHICHKPAVYRRGCLLADTSDAQQLSSYCGSRQCKHCLGLQSSRQGYLGFPVLPGHHQAQSQSAQHSPAQAQGRSPCQIR